MAVRMAPGNLSDQDCLKRILYRIPLYATWQRLVVDGGFAGANMEHYCQATFDLDLQIVKRKDAAPDSQADAGESVGKRPTADFVPLPCRWVVERTFAWMGRCRRFARDYEGLAEVSEQLQYLYSVRMLARRLAMKLS